MRPPLIARFTMALTLGCTVACAGSPLFSNGSGANGIASRAACERYVDHMNGLPCMSGLNYDPVEMCGALELSAADMTPYYECLVRGCACQGEIPQIKIDSCRAPTP